MRQQSLQDRILEALHQGESEHHLDREEALGVKNVIDDEIVELKVRLAEMQGWSESLEKALAQPPTYHLGIDAEVVQRATGSDLLAALRELLNKKGTWNLRESIFAEIKQRAIKNLGVPQAEDVDISMSNNLPGACVTIKLKGSPAENFRWASEEFTVAGMSEEAFAIRKIHAIAQDTLHSIFGDSMVGVRLEDEAIIIDIPLHLPHSKVIELLDPPSEGSTDGPLNALRKLLQSRLKFRTFWVPIAAFGGVVAKITTLDSGDENDS